MLSHRKRSSKSKLQKIKSVAFVTALLAFSAHAQVVKSCNDGDTCRVDWNGVTKRIRLSGIDAPETGQKLAEESKQFLLNLVLGKKVELNCDGKSYNRDTCSMKINGVDVQERLVEAGLALDSPKYSGGKYSLAQQKAKRHKLGFWGLSDPLSPYCYRNMPVACNSNRTFQH